MTHLAGCNDTWQTASVDWSNNRCAVLKRTKVRLVAPSFSSTVIGLKGCMPGSLWQGEKATEEKKEEEKPKFEAFKGKSYSLK